MRAGQGWLIRTLHIIALPVQQYAQMSNAEFGCYCTLYAACRQTLF
jgi:hypothetical protein